MKHPRAFNPINTGKVLIGACYVPPPRHLESDEVVLQSALLRKQRPRHKLWLWAYSLALIFAIGMAANIG